MGLLELKGTPYWETYVEPKLSTNVSPDYTAAVEQVRTAPAGTVISRAATVEYTPEVTGKVTELLTKPAVFPIIDLVQDFWSLAIGTREEKVITTSELIGGEVKTIPAYDIRTGGEQPTVKPLETFMSEVITKQKLESPETKTFWEQNVLAGSDIKIPDLPEIPNPFEFLGDIGNTLKWILIGGGALVGLYLVAKIIGGKK